MPHPAEASVGDHSAELERALIDQYLRARGYDLDTIHALPADEVRALLREAAVYAAARLTEVEARAAYVHEIHHGGTPSR